MTDGSYGMTARPDGRLHVVMWDAAATPIPMFVAFDAAAARAYKNAVDSEHECEVTAVEELALIDNFGFHVPRSQAATVAPWLAENDPQTAAYLLAH